MKHRYVTHEVLLRAYENIRKTEAGNLPSKFWVLIGHNPQIPTYESDKGWDFTVETANRVEAFASAHGPTLIKAYMIRKQDA